MDSNSNQAQPTTEGATQYNNINMLSLATASNTNASSTDPAKGPFDSNGPAPGTLSYYPQQTTRPNSDIGTMDDIQFSASLDALLNGEQLAAAVNPSYQAATPAPGTTTNSTLFTAAPPTQQHATQLSSSQQFLVSGPAAALTAPATGAPGIPQISFQAAPAAPAQPQTITLSATQLAGLPLASATQAPLQLVPAGPHSAAQMSLSAGHAAATGAFHPNPAAATASPPTAAGLPAIAQSTTAAFPWAITAAAPAVPTQSTSTAAVMKPAAISLSKSLTSTRRGKRPLNSKDKDVSAVSEDECDRERRRQERNQREQQRSHRITEQIATLRDVLSSVNVPFKPDKYSTLTKVIEYIQQLQDRSRVLDVEHKKLLDTITETNEIVNSQYVPAYTSGSDVPPIGNDVMGGNAGATSLEDESMVYVRGVDYKTAFKGCGIPMALASIDGRFLDCNDTFQELTGYQREELLPLEKPGCENTSVSFSPDQDDSQKKNLSMFNLLSRDGMDQVFKAMSEMLKQPGCIGTNQEGPAVVADFWSGPVKLGRRDDLPVKLNVTLVRTNRGRPKFFNCALTALDEENENDLRFDDQTTITTPSRSPSDDTKETITSGEQQVEAAAAPAAAPPPPPTVPKEESTPAAVAAESDVSAPPLDSGGAAPPIDSGGVAPTPENAAPPDNGGG